MSGEVQDVLAAIEWRLNHYGPLDAKPFQYSRYESRAHAVLAAVEESDWLAARVASAAAERDQAVAVADSMQHFADVAEVCERKSNEYAAENAALRARLDEVRALVDDLSALTEGPGRAGTALWPDAARDAYSLAIEEAQGVLRAVLAAAHDEGSEQQGSMAPQANEAAPESDSGADVGGNATGVIRGAQRGDSA